MLACVVNSPGAGDSRRVGERTLLPPVPAANPGGEEEGGEAAEIRRKVLGLHVLLLRIAMRLGQNPRSSIVQQVVYR